MFVNNTLVHVAKESGAGLTNDIGAFDFTDDNVPLPDELIAWLQAYTDAHYVPEPKKRKRPASFLPPGERK